MKERDCESAYSLMTKLNQEYKIQVCSHEESGRYSVQTSHNLGIFVELPQLVYMHQKYEDPKAQNHIQL